MDREGYLIKMTNETVPKNILDKLNAGIAITAGAISGRAKVYEDTSFVTGESPVTLDVNADLGRNAVDGFVINDGAGNFTVAISDDGATFGDALTMKENEVLSLTNMDIDQIKITWVANSAYRVFVV